MTQNANNFIFWLERTHSNVNMNTWRTPVITATKGPTYVDVIILILPVAPQLDEQYFLLPHGLSQIYYFLLPHRLVRFITSYCHTD